MALKWASKQILIIYLSTILKEILTGQYRHDQQGMEFEC